MDLATSVAQSMTAGQVTSGDVGSKLSNIDAYMNLINQKRQVSLATMHATAPAAAAGGTQGASLLTGGGSTGTKILGFPLWQVGLGVGALAILGYFAFGKKRR